jgi:hypothetical protein
MVLCNRAWWLAIAVIGAVLAGCGDDGGETVAGASGGGSGGTSGSGGGGGGDNNVQPGQICARLSQIQCAAEANCCDAPGRDIATCQADVAEECEDNGLDIIPMDPLVGFNAGALKRALDELEERNAECDPTVAAWAITTDGFASSFDGTRASGDDCAPEGGTMMATFSQIGAALGSCMNAGTTACLPTSDDDWTCAPRGDAGAPCFTDFNCKDSLFCDSSMADTIYDGVCTVRKAAGEDCDEDNECVSFLCNDDACAAANDAQAAFCD